MTIEICHGYYVKKAAYDQLSTDLAEALAALRDVIGWVSGAAGWITKAPIESVERARALLSKHAKGS